MVQDLEFGLADFLYTVTTILYSSYKVNLLPTVYTSIKHAKGTHLERTEMFVNYLGYNFIH